MNKRNDLTPNQERFVQEYVIDLNATQAAIMAGYSEKGATVRGSELLANRKVAAAVAGKQAAIAQRLDVTAERVYREYARIVFADPRNLMTWGPDGVRLRPSEELTEDEAAAVAEVSETTSKDGGTIRLKMHSKQPALHDLATILGMLKDKERDGDTFNTLNVFGDLTTDELRRLASGDR